MRSNLLGVYYPLMAAVEKKIKIFVMTGSNCALGHGYRISQRPFPLQYLPVDENHPSDVEELILLYQTRRRRAAGVLLARLRDAYLYPALGAHLRCTGTPGDGGERAIPYRLE